MTTATLGQAARPPRMIVLTVAGFALLAYAVLGNYLVLPGYRRFIEAGGASGSGAHGLALIWGAARTILWMYSFQLGAFCLALAALRALGDEAKVFRRGFCAGVIAWLAFWSAPRLPTPPAWYFASVGVLILAAVAALLWTLRARPAARERAPWRVASVFFFAVATWEVCGLGSVGGILRPHGSLSAANAALVATQTTKLIVELALAWLLALAAMVLPSRRPS